MASNFRALFHIQFNQWSKYPKSAQELWPLSIDQSHEQLTAEELYARNERIINQYKERHGIN